MNSVSGSRMQALLAFGVTLVIVLLVAGWTWTTHGSLHGSVTLAGVCRDVAADGVSPVTRCDEAPVSGANVIVSAGAALAARRQGQEVVRHPAASGQMPPDVAVGEYGCAVDRDLGVAGEASHHLRGR